MAALDFTINQMTMLALTLMVGIVIDDAIVVLENIYRFVEEKGMTPMRAAIEGTREIGLAVMATTLALLAVFVPVGFLGGIIGRFMSSFGLTSAAAIAISLIVSFTLTPMLAARWIKHDHDDKRRRRVAARLLPPHRPRLHRDADVLDGAPLGDRRRLRDGHRLDGAAVPMLGHQLHSGRGRIAVPDHGAAAGRIEPGGDAVADGADRARHARAAARRVRHAGVPGSAAAAGSARPTPAACSCG